MLSKNEITKETANLPARGSRSSSNSSSDHKPREKSYDRAASTPRPATTKKSNDPWFDKPYEPTGTGAVKPQSNQLYKTSKPKREVAALLGGLPRKG